MEYSLESARKIFAIQNQLHYDYRTVTNEKGNKQESIMKDI